MHLVESEDSNTLKAVTGKALPSEDEDTLTETSSGETVTFTTDDEYDSSYND